MSYASTSLFLQAAQYQQLQAISRTMWQQQAEEHRQRYLSDVLLAATQGSERVARTGRHDPVAAAILASRWLSTLSWLHAGLLSDFPRKQTWEQCRATLVQACDAVRADHETTLMIRDYLAVEDREVYLLGVFGNPSANEVSRTATDLLASAQTRAANTRADVTRRLLQITLVLFLCAIAAVLLGEFVSLAAGFLVGIVSALVLLVVTPISLAHALGAKSAAAAHEKYVKDCLVEWQTLEQSKPGLSLLTNVRRAHPYIFDQAPAAPAPLSGAGVERHTIERERVERQVVVARCRYCSSLTPVDLSNCRVCGAHKPI